MNKTNQQTDTLLISVFDTVSVSEKVSNFLNWITEQALKHIVAFSEALKKVHIRLISEGYLINSGVITKPVDAPKIKNKSKIQKT